MHGPFNTIVNANSASAVLTATMFLAMQVAYRSGLTRPQRWSDVTDDENEYATPYFGRVN